MYVCIYMYTSAIIRSVLDCDSRSHLSHVLFFFRSFFFCLISHCSGNRIPSIGCPNTGVYFFCTFFFFISELYLSVVRFSFPVRTFPVARKSSKLILAQRLRSLASRSLSHRNSIGSSRGDAPGRGPRAETGVRARRAGKIRGEDVSVGRSAFLLDSSAAHVSPRRAA